MPAIALKFRESRGPIDTPWGCELRRIEKRIWDNDKASIRARWESGQHILERREGKQLPKGLLKHLCMALEVSQSELSRRVQFAMAYPTETELSHAVTKFSTWRQIVTKALPKTRRRKPILPRVVGVQTLRNVMVQCHSFHTRKEIPARVTTELYGLYKELRRLFED